MQEIGIPTTQQHTREQWWELWWAEQRHSPPQPCPGRETHPKLAPEEWLPYCVHHEAHPPAARSAEWGAGNAGVVYSVPCNECSRAYIGQTGRSLDHRIAEHQQALRDGDVGGPRYWQSMCFLLGTEWIYPRQQWSILTLMSRPAAFLSPGTSSMNEPLATGERERCQDSMPPCWTDIVLCYYYVFCFTLHLIMYICRSMLPYYYHSFIGFLCCCCCCCCCFISFLMYSILSASCPSSCVFTSTPSPAQAAIL